MSVKVMGFVFFPDVRPTCLNACLKGALSSHAAFFTLAKCTFLYNVYLQNVDFQCPIHVNVQYTVCN